MARIPHGAELVENAVSKVPGFWIGNVIVMAGVPAIMQAMLDDVAPKLEIGAAHGRRDDRGGQSAGGRLCGRISPRSPRASRSLSIGSYPSCRDGAFHNEIVVRGKDAEQGRRSRRGDRSAVSRVCKRQGVG